jgi:selenobiotic family peptide radical SAM maturase
LAMNPEMKTTWEEIYPVCRSFLGREAWERILESCGQGCAPEAWPEILGRQPGEGNLPPFLPDLARLEWTRRKLLLQEAPLPKNVERTRINPTVELISVSWKGLPEYLREDPCMPSGNPEEGEEFVLVWKDPRKEEVRVQTADSNDLLALKMTAEGIETDHLAREEKVPVGSVENLLNRAVEKGILLRPPSRIRRNREDFPGWGRQDETFLVSSAFTLQWHLTQACDLHCKHCYDRTPKSSLRLDQALAVLDDLLSFCRNRSVSGQVSFTGGNPFLYPHFTEVYRGAVERGMGIAILGNPVSRQRLEEIAALQKPSYFQVSLEGMPAHNDSVRGEGHFTKTLDFLGVLREMGIYSMVMLTLTKDNLDQVLPLGKILRDRADLFTFNRLSPVGEGASLQLPGRGDYAVFLEDYHEAAQKNPILGLKDNLLNLVYYREGKNLFGGCCGFGCGAAFNFVSLLPDGEVHACRKLPSFLGNILNMSLETIYESEKADRHRAGSRACRSCEIRPVCGGCLAVTRGSGLNPFVDRDPYCFIDRALPPEGKKKGETSEESLPPC